MLHILWMIIKFILIVLGILLGLILLAVLLLLFCPVRYRAAVTKEESGLQAVKADAKISWLFGLIGFHAAYADGKPKLSFRIFGIPFEKIKGLLKKKKKGASSASKSDRKKSKKQKRKLKKQNRNPNKQNRNAVKQAEKKTQGSSASSVGAAASASAEESTKTGQSVLEREQKSKELEKEQDKTPDNTPEILPVTSEQEKKEDDAPAPDSPGLFSRILGKLKTILGIPVRIVKFLAALPGKIASAVQKIWVTIQNICGKIGWWRDFLEEEHTKAAIALVKERAGILLRHILPTKVKGSVTFGCEDPSTTGMILGVLGMSFPLHKNCIAVTPLFDGENHLTGKIFLKGRIYGIVLIIAAVKIYFNKNTKYVIHAWKTRS